MALLLLQIPITSPITTPPHFLASTGTPAGEFREPCITAGDAEVGTQLSD